MSMPSGGFEDMDYQKMMLTKTDNSASRKTILVKMGMVLPANGRSPPNEPSSNMHAPSNSAEFIMGHQDIHRLQNDGNLPPTGTTLFDSML